MDTPSKKSLSLFIKIKTSPFHKPGAKNQASLSNSVPLFSSQTHSHYHLRRVVWTEKIWWNLINELHHRKKNHILIQCQSSEVKPIFLQPITEKIKITTDNSQLIRCLPGIHSEERHTFNVTMSHHQQRSRNRNWAENGAPLATANECRWSSLKW